MTTSTTSLYESAFLADICEHPEDDGVRLIYADFLEENGQPERAEFIRVQVRLARMAEAPFGVGPAIDKWLAIREELRLRERELLQTMIDTSTSTRRAKTLASYLWAKESLDRHVCVWKYEYRRGFIEEATLPLVDWITHGHRLVRATPLRVVRLSDRRPWNSGNHRWGWSCSQIDSEFGDFWILPTDIFDYLQCNSQVTSLTRKWFKSSDDATSALSAALLALARGASLQTVQFGSAEGGNP